MNAKRKARDKFKNVKNFEERRKSMGKKSTGWHLNQGGQWKGDLDKPEKDK